MLSCVKLLLIGGNSPIDTDALKTLCLVICTIEDKRATQRVKKTKESVRLFVCGGLVYKY